MIGDPHITSNNECEWAGIYTVRLDKEGSQISNSITLAESKYLAYLETPFLVEFKKTGWMTNMPKRRKASLDK